MEWRSLGRTIPGSGAQGDVEARFTIALPARGRSILGEWAIDILIQNLPGYDFTPNPSLGNPATS